MKKYRQRITDPNIGDCFRSCIATLLQLPPEVLPNDFSPRWHQNWADYLGQFGLGLSSQNNAQQPIWQHAPWIASVRSLNFNGGTHAIIMHNGSQVLHDPSNKKRYKTGSYLTSKEVIAGQHIIVTDATKLHKLEDYRKYIRGDK